MDVGNNGILDGLCVRRLAATLQENRNRSSERVDAAVIFGFFRFCHRCCSVLSFVVLHDCFSFRKFGSLLYCTMYTKKSTLRQANRRSHHTFPIPGGSGLLDVTVASAIFTS